MSTCLIRCVEVTFIHYIMSAYRGHGRSMLFTGIHLTNNVQTANYKRTMHNVVFQWALSNSATTVCFTRQRIVSTGLSPQLEWKRQNFFVKGTFLCPCEIKISIFSIHYFHFSSANVSVAGGIVESSAFIKQ